MAGLTTMIVGTVLGLGAVNEQRKAREEERKQRNEARKRARQQELEAREAAKLKSEKKLDPRIKLGTTESSTSKGAGSKSAASTRKNTVGLGGLGDSKSPIGGL